MPQRRGTWLPINERFFVRIWCVVMAASGSRASLWQQLSITQWYRTLHETPSSSQTWAACQPAVFPSGPLVSFLIEATRHRRAFPAPPARSTSEPREEAFLPYAMAASGLRGGGERGIRIWANHRDGGRLAEFAPARRRMSPRLSLSDHKVSLLHLYGCPLVVFLRFACVICRCKKPIDSLLSFANLISTLALSVEKGKLQGSN